MSLSFAPCSARSRLGWFVAVAGGTLLLVAAIGLSWRQGGEEEPGVVKIQLVPGRPEQSTQPSSAPAISLTPQSAIESEVLLSNPDVAHLHERLEAEGPDPARTYLAERLKQRVERISTGGTRFAGLAVKCGKALCEISGSIISVEAPASLEAAFALAHHEGLVSIAASEGLEPGPVTVLITSAGETKFVGYLATP